MIARPSFPWRTVFQLPRATDRNKVLNAVCSFAPRTGQWAAFKPKLERSNGAGRIQAFHCDAAVDGDTLLAPSREGSSCIRRQHVRRALQRAIRYLIKCLPRGADDVVVFTIEVAPASSGPGASCLLGTGAALYRIHHNIDDSAISITYADIARSSASSHFWKWTLVQAAVHLRRQRGVYQHQTRTRTP